MKAKQKGYQIDSTLKRRLPAISDNQDWMTRPENSAAYT